MGLFVFLICFLVAVYATVNTVGFVRATEKRRKLLLCFANATRIFAGKTFHGFAHTGNVGLVFFHSEASR
jgi:hypothetical protein